VGKGADVSAAINKATDVAKKSLIQFPMHNGTLTHEVLGKVGGSRILIMPAAPGTGLIAGGVVRTVLEVAGFEDALSKSIGSSNKLNTAYATLEALKGMEPTSKWVTRTNNSAKEAAATPKKAAVKAE
jgi:small subunit ribosomal protein S5